MDEFEKLWNQSINLDLPDSIEWPVYEKGESVATRKVWGAVVEELANKNAMLVGEGVSKLKTKDKGYLVVTHYQWLLQYIKPDVVHVFVDGAIVESGGLELSNKLEEQGYESYV